MNVRPVEGRQPGDAGHISVQAVTTARAASSRFSRWLGAAVAALRRDFPHFRTGAAAMDSYEFAYFGRDHRSLEDTIAAWCSRRKCSLETTELLEGATFRISGPDESIREAMQMVRVWMLTSR